MRQLALIEKILARVSLGEPGEEILVGWFPHKEAGLCWSGQRVGEAVGENSPGKAL
jgi:hypothetical protein